MHQPDIQTDRLLEGCNSGAPAAAEFDPEHCYSGSARTSLHLTGESASLLREGETEEKRGNSTAALCFSLANPCGDYPPTPSFSQPLQLSGRELGR